MAFYLKDGRGDACAGQVRAKPSFCLLMNSNDFVSCENFGLVPPTGSSEK